MKKPAEQESPKEKTDLDAMCAALGPRAAVIVDASGKIDRVVRADDYSRDFYQQEIGHG